MDTITINGTGNKHIIQATVEHNITDGFDFGDTAWGPPVKDYTYLSSSQLRIQLAYPGPGGTTLFDLEEFIDVGYSWGSMIRINGVDGTLRWMNGGYFKAGQLNGQTLPTRTYPRRTAAGNVVPFSILIPTVAGRVYSLIWSVRAQTEVAYIDNTVAPTVSTNGTVMRRVYAITEIKK